MNGIPTYIYDPSRICKHCRVKGSAFYHRYLKFNNICFKCKRNQCMKSYFKHTEKRIKYAREYYKKRKEINEMFNHGHNRQWWFLSC